MRNGFHDSEAEAVYAAKTAVNKNPIELPTNNPIKACFAVRAYLVMSDELLTPDTYCTNARLE